MIDFLLSRWSFPSWDVWLAFFPAGIAAGVVSGWLAGRSWERWNLPAGYSRKIFHFLIFSLACAIGAASGFEAVQVFGAAVALVVIHAVWRGYDSRLFAAVARPSDRPFERFYVVVPLLMTALGGMLSNILFGGFALVGYIATGWGDAVGEPVGTRWGKHRYRVPTFTGIVAYRSLEGSLAVCLASWIGCGLVLLLALDVSIFRALWISLVLSWITTLVEAISFHSVDNLTIQIAASGGCASIFYLWGIA